MNLKKIKLKDIRIDGGTQSRELINENAVVEYTEALLNGNQLPPMDVFQDGVSLWLVDGFHRYFAHKRAGINEVEVLVHKGTNRDAIKFSLGVNGTHGLPRTNADKRKVVLIALNDIEWQDLSDVEIGKMCHVSDRFVSKVRNEHNIERPTEKQVTRSDGKTHKMETKNIGKKKAEPEPVTTLKPIEQMEEDDPTEDDHIAELAAVNKDLAEENEKLHDKTLAMSADEEKIANQFSVLRSTIKALELELQATKNSRDQFQAKNAELIKQVNYWKKRAEKAEKVV